MKRSTLLLFCCALSVISFAQVKSQYQYSTTMPYGTLDIRTRISSTDYYYLKENQTFAFRESSPGVKTNTYLDMTGFDSSPYKQGHLRRKTGTADKFVMNYRLLFPNNYSTTYTEGYPMIVLVHGAGERANCLYNNCYHGGWAYEPNANSPPAPTTATHKLLNNDHSLNIGGKQHLDARNLAGTRLPNDPTMPSRAFQGFVLVAQMFNEWEPLQVQDLIRIVRLHCDKYKIDPNRIYIHGLSIGGYGVYEALKRAPWLFAAALPMSAINDAGIFQHNQQAKVVHVPIWTFQGGQDTKPTPATTNTIVNNFRNAGAIVKYTTYADLGHNVWNRAYGEADFFKWMLSKNKADIHAYKDIKVIVKSTSQYPRLMLGEGFLAYQWERNGAIISGATSNTYTATTPGTYRARFSRLSSAPTTSQWNKWSAAVTITETTAAAATQLAAAGEAEDIVTGLEAEAFAVQLYPNPAKAGNLNLHVSALSGAPVEVRLVDQLGVEHYRGAFTVEELQQEQQLNVPTLPDGIYILWVNQDERQIKQRVVIRN